LLLLLFETFDKLPDARVAARLFNRRVPILILDADVAAIAHQGVNGLIIMVVHGDDERSIAPLVSAVDVGPSQR